MSRYYELADVAEMFPAVFLGRRVIEAKTSDASYKLSVTGFETAVDIWRMLLDSGFSKDPSRCRLVYDNKDISESVHSVDLLEIPNGAVVAIVDRFDFELSLPGGAGGASEHSTQAFGIDMKPVS